MWKKVSFGIFLAASIIGIIYWLSYVREIKAPVSDPMLAIPSDAAFIIESHQLRKTWNKLSNTNIMWEELIGTQTFAVLNAQAGSIDSLLQLDPEIASLLDEHPVLISAHRTDKENTAFLFSYSLPNLTHAPALEKFIEVNDHVKEENITEYRSVPIGIIQTANNGEVFWSVRNGTAVFSFSKKLIEASLLQRETGRSLASGENFRKIRDAAGKKVDANLYIHYANFPGILDPYTKKKNSNLGSFAECSGWDITLKPNALMLNGFTRVNDTLPSFLGTFLRQKPQEIEITGILPSNTALMIYYGVSNMRTFHEDTKLFYDPSAKKVTSEYEEHLLQWMNNEMALVTTEKGNNDTLENVFAAIRANDIEEALQSLEMIRDSSTSGETDTSSFRGYTIRCLGGKVQLSDLFGPAFGGIKNNFYTSVEDYVVFAESPGALHHFIDYYESNKTLSNNRNYKAFSENLSTDANYFIYSSLPRSGEILRSLLKEEYVPEAGSKAELISRFEGAAIQFSSSKGAFYSTAFLRYNPEYKKENTTLWELKLDTTVSSKPFLLVNHNTQAKEVLIQDDANTIYLISNTGKIIWTKQLQEKIMSNVMQLDVLKNDKKQMIFNTRSAIYMFDRNGNDMKGFPVKLKSPATNAVSIVDYDNNRDYRIFIALENKKILCLKSNGQPVEGFSFEATRHPVYFPIQYFRAASKDHLCAIDSKGKIYILNRQGETRVNMKEEMAQGIRGFFVEPGKDYKRTFIIAADTLGNIIRISLTGEKEKIKFQDFETSPYFEYRDLQNDKTKEYVFLTRKELKVFSPDRSLLFRHEFSGSITHPPSLFLFPEGKTRIGVVAEQEGELFLFDDHGSLSEGFPLSGKTLFSIGDMNNDGSFNLVTGSSDNSIFVYQVR